MTMYCRECEVCGCALCSFSSEAFGPKPHPGPDHRMCACIAAIPRAAQFLWHRRARAARASRIRLPSPQAGRRDETRHDSPRPRRRWSRHTDPKQRGVDVKWCRLQDWPGRSMLYSWWAFAAHVASRATGANARSCPCVARGAARRAHAPSRLNAARTRPLLLRRRLGRAVLGRGGKRGSGWWAYACAPHAACAACAASLAEPMHIACRASLATFSSACFAMVGGKIPVGALAPVPEAVPGGLRRARGAPDIVWRGGAVGDATAGAVQVAAAPPPTSASVDAGLYDCAAAAGGARRRGPRVVVGGPPALRARPQVCPGRRGLGGARAAGSRVRHRSGWPRHGGRRGSGGLGAVADPARSAGAHAADLSRRPPAPAGAVTQTDVGMAARTPEGAARGLFPPARPPRPAPPAARDARPTSRTCSLEASSPLKALLWVTGNTRRAAV